MPLSYDPSGVAAIAAPAPDIHQMFVVAQRRSSSSESEVHAKFAKVHGMPGTSLSRWTMLHFAIALAAFVTAQAVVVVGWCYPAAPVGAPATLAVVHLLTIGWLTILILGALHQFVPMVTARPAAGGPAALLPLIGIGVGLAGMVVGFLSLDGTLPAVGVVELPVGGVLVLLSVTLAAATLAPPLWQTRPIALPARFVLAGLGFLLATCGLGLTFAAVLACPTVFPWGQLLAVGLRAHVVGGLVGWLTLTVLGVSYRMLGMFMLAPDDRGRLGHTAFLLTACGLAIAWLASLAQMLDTPALHTLVAMGEAIAALGVALYLGDMVRLYRARRRRALELHSVAAAASLGALAVAIVLLVVADLASSFDDVTGPALYLLVFGWLSGLALGQLYKLVPFLTWLQRYSSLLGKAPVPSVEELVNERRAAPWFVLYFGAVTIGTACGLLGWPAFWRLAVAAHLLATIGIARELWRARRWSAVRTASSRGAGSAWRPSPQTQHGAPS
jgi:hypothetical protein